MDVFFYIVTLCLSLLYLWQLYKTELKAWSWGTSSSFQCHGAESSVVTLSNGCLQPFRILLECFKEPINKQTIFANSFFSSQSSLAVRFIFGGTNQIGTEGGQFFSQLKVCFSITKKQQQDLNLSHPPTWVLMTKVSVAKVPRPPGAIPSIRKPQSISLQSVA